MFSTRDFSTSLLRTGGKVPSPRAIHVAALIGTIFLIYGGLVDMDDIPNNDNSLYLLDLGTSDLLMSSPAPAKRRFALQYRESGPALW